jgi:uncharacterized protein
MSHPAPWKRRTAALSRWLHLYLSMFSFMIVLFFAVTGLTLNHADWFTRVAKPTLYKGAIDAALLKDPDSDASRLAIVGALRRTHGIKSRVSDYRTDDSECDVSFKGPGYVADVSINRATGRYQLGETRLGAVAVLNDLHKGRDSGKAWSAVIDVSAILMTLVSATGLVLIFFLQKHRMAGFAAIGVGTAICLLVYWFLI